MSVRKGGSYSSGDAELVDKFDTGFAEDRSFDDPFAIAETQEYADLPFSSATSAGKGFGSGYSNGTYGSTGVDYSEDKFASSTIGGGAPRAAPPSAASSSGGAAAGSSSGGSGSGFSLGGLKGLFGGSKDESSSSSSSQQGGGISGTFDRLRSRAQAAAAPAEEKRYLSYERRSLHSQMGYNVGYSYFGGLLLGGCVGMLQGLRTAPNSRPRILINSILNGSGKYGSRAGNAAGILSMLYTGIERALEDVEMDKLPFRLNAAVGVDIFPEKWKYDLLLPATTAFLTGTAFMLPRAIAMRGLEKQYVTVGKRVAVTLTGGMATVAGVAALAAVGPYIFGRRSPYRFAA